MRTLSATLLGSILLALTVGVVGAVQPQPPEGRPVELGVTSTPGGSTAAGGWAPDAPVNLVLDDGTAEMNTGVGDGVAGYQFIWLNRFTPEPADFPFHLQQVSVAFCDPTVPLGGAVDIIVYEDTDGDGDPGDATWLATVNETVQYNDCTFSVYDLAAPVLLNGPGDVLLGLVNRYVESGMEPQDYPAALDLTTSAQRSWIGAYLWGDPPDPPLLPPDMFWALIDDFGTPGNWLIRGAGETGGEAAVFATHVRILPLGGPGWLLGIVRIATGDGSTPVPGATVDVTWTIPPGGGYQIPQTRVANANGLAFPLMLSNWSGTYVLDLAGVSAAGYVYDPDMNWESSATYVKP